MSDCLTLFFKIDEDGDLLLHTNNDLIKEHKCLFNKIINNYFNGIKDDIFVVCSFKRKYNFVIVTIKHKNKNINDFLKRIRWRWALSQLKILRTSAINEINTIKLKRYKTKKELQFLKNQLKTALKIVKKIKKNFPDIYEECKNYFKKCGYLTEKGFLNLQAD